MTTECICYLCDLMECFPGMGFENHCDVIPFDDCGCLLHPFTPLGDYIDV